jgi:hypothetical protein
MALCCTKPQQNSNTDDEGEGMGGMKITWGLLPVLQIFTELTCDQQQCVQVSYTEFCPHRKQMLRVRMTIILFPWTTHLTLLRRFSLNLLALSKHLLTASAPNFIQSDEKCRKCMQSFICSRTQSMVLVIRIFKTRTINQRHYVEISCTEFHPSFQELGK